MTDEAIPEDQRWVTFDPRNVWVYGPIPMSREVAERAVTRAASCGSGD